MAGEFFYHRGRKKHRFSAVLAATRIYKPGSVLTAIYLARQLPDGSSRLLGTVGPTMRSSTALLRNRVYSVKPMLPWAGCALTAPFHPYRRENPSAESLCCTCPEVTLGGRYPLFLPCGARTFLIWGLSASIRGCPIRLRRNIVPQIPSKVKCLAKSPWGVYTIEEMTGAARCIFF